MSYMKSARRALVWNCGDFYDQLNNGCSPAAHTGARSASGSLSLTTRTPRTVSVWAGVSTLQFPQLLSPVGQPLRNDGFSMAFFYFQQEI